MSRPSVTCCGILWHLVDDDDPAQAFVNLAPGVGASYSGKCGKCSKSLVEVALVVRGVELASAPVVQDRAPCANCGDHGCVQCRPIAR